MTTGRTHLATSRRTEYANAVKASRIALASTLLIRKSLATRRKTDVNSLETFDKNPRVWSDCSELSGVIGSWVEVLVPAVKSLTGSACKSESRVLLLAFKRAWLSG